MSGDLKVGATLGNYKLTGVLGEGGMGRVYKARDKKRGRTVAIKVLHPKFAERDDTSKRFIREAKVICDIGHKNIVEVYELSEQDGQVFCVMEMLVGESVEQMLSRKKAISPDEAIEIMGQVAEALEAAHATGVIHRDLKPDNLFLLKKKREGQQVKVLDFGLAKLIDGTTYTAEGVVMGTPSYMSVEQATSGAVDPRSDIYSFGVVLYR